MRKSAILTPFWSILEQFGSSIWSKSGLCPALWCPLAPEWWVERPNDHQRPTWWPLAGAPAAVASWQDENGQYPLQSSMNTSESPSASSEPLKSQQPQPLLILHHSHPLQMMPNPLPKVPTSPESVALTADQSNEALCNHERVFWV